VLASDRIEILQLNVGRMCNQTCAHCHVDAGPDRKEIMTRATMLECLAALDDSGAELVDVTGGAPEMNPDFRWLVERVRERGRRVMDRCNLTILLAPRYEDLPDFLARHGVEVVASLPSFAAQGTDRQRGDGVFEKSIEALRRLNAVGYGMPGSGLALTLVHNPVGAFLPPDQAETEALYRQRLRDGFGIEFHRLFTIANQPINRYLEFLLAKGQFETYMTRLVEAFNAAAVEGLMCRNTLSVGWDGRLFDCDFNQMLDLDLGPGLPRTIGEWNRARLDRRPIVTGLHCYACTAGQGSSCGGATVT
jgi:radical SAM/Cys-rich protein